MSCANSAAMDESSSSDFWQLRSQETAATSRETWRLIHQLLITQQSMGLWRDKEEDHHQKTGSKSNTQQLEEFMELARNGMSEGPTPLMSDLSLTPPINHPSGKFENQIEAEAEASVEEPSQEIDSNPQLIEEFEKQEKCCEPSEMEIIPIEDASQSMDSESGCVEGSELEDGSVEDSVLLCSANKLSNFSTALNPSECESSNSPTTCIPLGTLRLELEIKSISRVLDSSENLERNLYADKVFTEMAVKKVVSFESKRIVGQSIEYRTLEFGRKWGYLDGDNDMNLVFDPGGIDMGLLSSKSSGESKVSKPQWNAHKVFEEMSTKQIVLFGSYFELRSIDTREFFEFSALAPNLRGGTVIFKPNTSNRVSNLYPYDRGKVALHYEGCNMFQMEPTLISQGVALLPDIAAAVAKHRVLDRKVVFDPGIASFGSEQSRTKSTLSTHVTWKVPAEYGIGLVNDKGLSLIRAFLKGLIAINSVIKCIFWSYVGKGLLVIKSRMNEIVDMVAAFSRLLLIFADL